jgi:hypothetical protein
VHARQRVLLGRWATPRLLVAQVGIAAVSVGVPTDAPVLIQLGLALVGACAIVAVGLMAAALRPIVPSLVARSVA